MADHHPSFTRLKQAAATVNVKLSKHGELGAALGETAQTITNWAKRGVPALAAIAAQRELGISPAWIMDGVPPAFLSQSQPTRLDQQMMAEALVAVLKAQEAMRLEFRAAPIAEALTRAYDLRTLNPASMSKAELDSFDRLIQRAVRQAWESEDGSGTSKQASGGIGRSDAKAPAKRQRVAAGRER